MTFVGRILIVVQVILTVLFMAFAGAVFTVQTSWKDRAENLSEQLQTTKQSLSDKESEFEDYKTEAELELNKQTDKATQFEAANTRLEAEVAQLDERIKTLATQLETQRSLAKLNTEEADFRTKDTELQRAENVKLHETRTQLESEVRSLEDQVFSLTLQQKQMTAKHNDVLKDNAMLRSALVNAGLDPERIAAQQAPPPKVDGFVREVQAAERGQKEFVEITIGSDDGLTIGNDLTVFRDDKYLGKIRLIYVTPDRAVGSVTDKSKNSVIQRGDNVTTKL